MFFFMRDDRIDAVETVIIRYKAGIIILQGLGQGAEGSQGKTHIRILPATGQDILPVRILQLAVDPPFVPAIGRDQQRESDPGGETKNIEKGIEAAPVDMS